MRYNIELILSNENISMSLMTKIIINPCIKTL